MTVTSGSRACDITINGRYDGEIEALELNDIPIDTNAYASLYLQVYDVTGGGFTLVKQQKVFERGVAFTLLPNQISGTMGSAQKMSCTLHAGRNYLIRASLRTEADCGFSPGSIQVWGRSDFASNPKGPSGQGADISSIRIQWI